MSSHIGEVLAALGTCFDSLGVRWYLFDLDDVRRMLQLLEEALSQSDLISQLEQLIRREKRSAR